MTMFDTFLAVVLLHYQTELYIGLAFLAFGPPIIAYLLTRQCDRKYRRLLREQAVKQEGS